MGHDLDGADLAEVRRRVVDPVLSALLAPGEVDEVRVQVGSPYAPFDGEDEEDRPPYVYAVMVGDGDVLAVPVAKLIFDRSDADDGQDELYGAVQDWICFSSFGWGQWRVREMPEAPPAPVRVWGTPGRRCLEFYPEEGVASPLWEQGVSVPLEQLPLSQALAGELAGWVRRWEQATDDEGAWPGWVAMVQELDPERDRLVTALRNELPDGVEVAQPIRLDEMTRQWRAGRLPRLPAAAPRGARPEVTRAEGPSPRH